MQRNFIDKLNECGQENMKKLLSILSDINYRLNDEFKVSHEINADSITIFCNKIHQNNPGASFNLIFMNSNMNKGNLNSQNIFQVLTALILICSKDDIDLRQRPDVHFQNNLIE